EYYCWLNYSGAHWVF
nr:immunoglobulin light chain junction region [Macaca mulatta]